MHEGCYIFRKVEVTSSDGISPLHVLTYTCELIRVKAEASRTTTLVRTIGVGAGREAANRPSASTSRQTYSAALVVVCNQLYRMSLCNIVSLQSVFKRASVLGGA